MANNVYIGNRYVPIFANPVEWDSLRTYEALTIVTYLGTSYTSRKAVPAGIQLSNTEYWVVTGNYNAQVAQLMDEVTGLETDFDNLESNVTSQVTGLNNKVNTLLGFYKRRVIMLSDSYGNRVNSQNKTFFTLFKEKTGLSNSDFYSSSVAGGCFAHANTAGKFLTLLQNLSGTVTSHDTITDIIVVGGANDAIHSYSSNISAISDFIAYAKTEYSNAKITVFDCGVTLTSPDMYAKSFYAHKAFVDSDVYVVPNAQYLLYNSGLLESDRCHPNASGVDTIAGALIKAVTGGGCDVYYSMTPTATSVSVSLSDSARMVDYAFAPRLTQSNGTLTLSEAPNASYHMFRFRANLAQVAFTGATIVMSGTVGLTDYLGGDSDNKLNFIGTLVEEGETYNNVPVRVRIETNSNNAYVMYITPLASFRFKNSSTSNGYITIASMIKEV